MKQRTMSDLTCNFQLKDMNFSGRLLPAVKQNEEGYSIRVMLTKKFFMNGDVEESFAYFELDTKGLIFKAPRGHSSDWKNCCITDIAEYYKKHYSPPPKTILKKKKIKKIS